MRLVATFVALVTLAAVSQALDNKEESCMVSIATMAGNFFDSNVTTDVNILLETAEKTIEACHAQCCHTAFCSTALFKEQTNGSRSLCRLYSCQPLSACDLVHDSSWVQFIREYRLNGGENTTESIEKHWTNTTSSNWAEPTIESAVNSMTAESGYDVAVPTVNDTTATHSTIFVTSPNSSVTSPRSSSDVLKELGDEVVNEVAASVAGVLPSSGPRAVNEINALQTDTTTLETNWSTVAVTSNLPTDTLPVEMEPISAPITATKELIGSSHITSLPSSLSASSNSTTQPSSRFSKVTLSSLLSTSGEGITSQSSDQIVLPPSVSSIDTLLLKSSISNDINLSPSSTSDKTKSSSTSDKTKSSSPSSSQSSSPLSSNDFKIIPSISTSVEITSINTSTTSQDQSTALKDQSIASDQTLLNDLTETTLLTNPYPETTANSTAEQTNTEASGALQKTSSADPGANSEQVNASNKQPVMHSDPGIPGDVPRGLSQAMAVLLICTLTFGCVFLMVVLAVLGRRIYDGYQKRHYSRLDYLINGMYN